MNKKGFTLIELLVVIGIIAILAGVVVVALNPARQFSQANDTKRWSNVNTILNAVGQYMADNKGALPTTIPVVVTSCEDDAAEICRTDVVTPVCTGLIDLSVLTTDELYLVDIPTDPKGFTTYGAGYHVVKSANNRVTVCAPDAEIETSISVKR